jgi:hypothetical protein
VSDIDTAVVDCLKVLDPKRPIREADIRRNLACLALCISGSSIRPSIDREAPMNADALLAGLAFTILVAATSPVFSQQAPPPSERAKQIEALVTNAAALIDSKGKTAFVDFRTKDSEWFHGDIYLFVLTI